MNWFRFLTPSKPQAEKPDTVLFFFYLIQDLDLLLPVIQRLKREKIAVAGFVAPHLFQQSPRVLKALNANSVSVLTCSPDEYKKRKFVDWSKIAALVTSAETTAKAHTPAYEAVKQARRKGIPTYTFQHGLENNGLTYYDKEFPVHKVDFGSETIFTWCNESVLHPEVPKHIRRRCKTVGCIKDYDASSISVPEFKNPNPHLISIFENLHWGRYSDEYRQKFLHDLKVVAQKYSNITFILKPHHAGQWFTKQKTNSSELPNLIVADPKDARWEPFTAPSIIKLSDAVITTPSTTAFDAASLGCPVAIVGYDLSLPIYEPLPILRDTDAWSEFLASVVSAENRSALFEKNKLFLNKVSAPGDALGKVVDYIMKDHSQPRKRSGLEFLWSR